MARLRRFQLGQNPYATPTECHAADRPARRIPMSRGEIARRFAITGFVGGGILGSFGYLALIVVIEILLTPPFSSPANYGQFMVVVVYVAFYMFDVRSVPRPGPVHIFAWIHSAACSRSFLDLLRRSAILHRGWLDGSTDRCDAHLVVYAMLCCDCV